LAVKSVSAVVLIGMRSPLRDGRALVARVENPSAIFESDEAPRIAPSLDELDLGGNGIRAMAFIPVLSAYLLIGGPPVVNGSRWPADFAASQAPSRDANSSRGLTWHRPTASPRLSGKSPWSDPSAAVLAFEQQASRVQRNRRSGLVLAKSPLECLDPL